MECSSVDDLFPENSQVAGNTNSFQNKLSTVKYSVSDEVFSAPGTLQTFQVSRISTSHHFRRCPDQKKNGIMESMLKTKEINRKYSTFCIDFGRERGCGGAEGPGIHEDQTEVA